MDQFAIFRPLVLVTERKFQRVNGSKGQLSPISNSDKKICEHFAAIIGAEIMHSQLVSFVMQYCQRVTPSCSTPLKSVIQSYHGTLDAAERKRWPRTRVVGELSKEFKIIFDRSQRWCVAGLGLLPNDMPIRQGGHLIP
jgi:hypothetical protein